MTFKIEHKLSYLRVLFTRKKQRFIQRKFNTIKSDQMDTNTMVTLIDVLGSKLKLKLS